MFFVLILAWGKASSAERPPNIVLIMTDNQGAWTLGCYGNPHIRTPHIDQLAREGMIFTRAFSSNAVCSPTRATYLTGLLPSQHGVHNFLGLEGSQMGPSAYCTIQEFVTLPQVLAGAGYVCGLSGKWHLGNNLHPQKSFTEWATMPYGHTTTFYDAEVIERGQVHKEPTYLTDFWTDRAVRFIEKNKDRPFFLFLSYNGPYGLGPSLLRPARNRHAAWYADKPLLSFPHEPMHPWLHDNKAYLNNLSAIRRVAAEVSGVDDGVGRVMEALKAHGLDDNTLVVFTADNGWVGGQNGLWGMGDHTRPLAAFDGMMRIPLFVRHPGTIPAGSTSDSMTSNYDFMPTLLGYLGLADKMSGEPRSPGRDYSPTLRGRLQDWDNTVFWEYENARAIRTADWKYIERYPDGPHELYNLQTDFSERINLYGRAEHAALRGDLYQRLHKFFNEYADPKYDLWRGGRSKARLLTADGASRLPQ